MAEWLNPWPSEPPAFAWPCEAAQFDYVTQEYKSHLRWPENDYSYNRPPQLSNGLRSFKPPVKTADIPDPEIGNPYYGKYRRGLQITSGSSHIPSAEPEIEDYGRGVVVTPAVARYQHDRIKGAFGRQGPMPTFTGDKLGPKRQQSPTGLRRLPPTKYGYWVTPEGVIHVVPTYGHAEVAAEHFGDPGLGESGYTRAHNAGWVRIAPGGEFDVRELDDQTKAIITELAANESLGDSIKIWVRGNGGRKGSYTAYKRKDILNGILTRQ